MEKRDLSPGRQGDFFTSMMFGAPPASSPNHMQQPTEEAQVEEAPTNMNNETYNTTTPSNQSELNLADLMKLIEQWGPTLQKLSPLLALFTSNKDSNTKK